MHPNDVKLEHLRGGWRCRLNKEDYFDLSIMFSQDRFLYDEIRNGERDLKQARVGVPVITNDHENRILKLDDIRLEIFAFEETELTLKYRDGSKRRFKKFTG